MQIKLLQQLQLHPFEYRTSGIVADLSKLPDCLKFTSFARFYHRLAECLKYYKCVPANIK